MSDHARLQITDVHGQRTVALDRPLYQIGRRLSADLHVGSSDVSRDHAEIAVEQGRYILRDHGSRYGTFVNGEQVRERVLQDGDRIRFGRTDSVELSLTAMVLRYRGR